MVGSMTPSLIRSPYSPVAAFRPSPAFRPRTFSTTTEPSRPEFSAIWRSGSSSERADDLRARLLVGVGETRGIDGVLRVQERDAAARHDALLERRASCLKGVLNAVLLLLHLGLGGGADLDDRDTAGELGEALLELLAIEVGVGVLDLLTDLADPALDLLLLAGAVDDRRRVLRDDDAAGTPELGHLGVLQLQTHLLGDDLATA